MALQAATGNIWHRLYSSLQGRSRRKHKKLSFKRTKSGIELTIKCYFCDSRYELVYGGELRWTPGGQFSDILQQEAKQFLRESQRSQ